MIELAVVLTVYMVAMILLDGWTTIYGMKSGKAREVNPALLKLQAWIERQPYGGPWLWLALAKAVNVVILGVLWAVYAAGLIPLIAVVIALALQAVVYTKVVGWGNYKAITRND